MRLLARRGRRRQDGARQHPLRHGRTRGRSRVRQAEVTSPAQNRYSRASLTSDQSHQGPDRRPRSGSWASRSRAAVIGPRAAHVVEHGLDQLRAIADDPAHPAPRVVLDLGHPPPHQRLGGHRQQARLVAPILEQGPWGALRHPVEQHRVVRPEPAECGQVVGPRQHVDRVNLKQPGAAHQGSQVPRGRPRGPRRGQPLRRQGKAAGLAGGQPLQAPGHVISSSFSRTA